MTHLTAIPALRPLSPSTVNKGMCEKEGASIPCEEEEGGQPIDAQAPDEEDLEEAGVEQGILHRPNPESSQSQQ